MKKATIWIEKKRIAIELQIYEDGQCISDGNYILCETLVSLLQNAVTVQKVECNDTENTCIEMTFMDGFFEVIKMKYI